MNPNHEIQTAPTAPQAAPRRETHPRPCGAGRIGLLPSALLLALALALPASADDPASCAAGEGGQSAPGHVFDSIEAAAIHALAHAHREASPEERGHYRFGVIRPVTGGFTFSPPRSSAASIWARSVPTLRLRLAPGDVASYVLHPATGHRELDRANERLARGARELVDEIDARRRPLFVLTPSRRIKRYASRTLVEVTRLDPWGDPPPTASRALTLADR
jgi:hypothetical protein